MATGLELHSFYIFGSLVVFKVCHLLERQLLGPTLDLQHQKPWWEKTAAVCYEARQGTLTRSRSSLRIAASGHAAVREEWMAGKQPI